MRARSAIVFGVLATAASALGACSGGSTVTGGSDGGAPEAGQPASPSGPGADAGASGPTCLATYPVSQPLSAPCCKDRGADACGAGLFCAAFDGRTQTTCYAERSRNDGETCTANLQCVSNDCSASGVCASASGCTTPGGCGPVNPPPPKPGMCPATCTTNSECQAGCPMLGTYVSCCDTTTSVCYSSNSTKCPTP